MDKAHKFMKDADSDFNGGLFSKPDFLSAGSKYSKAYDIFINDKMYKEAKDASEKNCNCL